MDYASSVLTDYQNYVRSFLKLDDAHIRDLVEQELFAGEALWPEALIQLNPPYALGSAVDELCRRGQLHPGCAEIFCREGLPFTLYHHQEAAIQCALRREPFVVTSGTGSGKTLTYFIPIFDAVLRSDPTQARVRAIIVYPMNALVNSQDIFAWMKEERAFEGEDSYYRKKEKELTQFLLLWLAGYHLAQGNEIGWRLAEKVASSIGSIWQSGFQDTLDWFNSLGAARAWQRDYPLTEDDLKIIEEHLRQNIPFGPAQKLIDVFGAVEALINRRCPRWLVGFRDVTNATNERTAIFSVLPRAGVGHTTPLMMLTQEKSEAPFVTCLIANLNTLVFDFIARQKVGGMHLTYNYLKQLPVLASEAYSEADLLFIVPRVLELVYTAWDLEAFAWDVWQDAGPELRQEIARRWQECCSTQAGQVRPDAESLPPFRWDAARRAIIRAELDAYYARLYGLTRDELRYILDPKDVCGPDFPGETFRVLKEKEERQYGEYRTRRLVLGAWDRLESGRNAVKRPS